jgi:hypothetical protein
MRAALALKTMGSPCRSLPRYAKTPQCYRITKGNCAADIA